MLFFLIVKYLFAFLFETILNIFKFFVIIFVYAILIFLIIISLNICYIYIWMVTLLFTHVSLLII